MKHLNFFVLLITVLFAVPGIMAQPLKGNEVVSVELITDADDLSKPFTVGIKFRIDPDWYLYWKNPGDAGLPIEVQWQLPTGWTAGAIQHPVPKKFVYDKIVAYGYKKEVTLLSTITPTGRTTGPIMANLDWLVCKESCVGGKAEVLLDMGRHEKGKQKEVKQNLDRSRAALPISQHASGISISDVRVSKADDEIFVEVKLQGKQAEHVTDFYPDVLKGVFIEFSSIRVANRTLTLRLRSGKDYDPNLELKGLMITGEKGYESSILIHLPNTL